MAIDDDILKYYIDCGGDWPECWQWVYLKLKQHTTAMNQRKAWRSLFG